MNYCNSLEKNSRFKQQWVISFLFDRSFKKTDGFQLAASPVMQRKENGLIHHSREALDPTFWVTIRSMLCGSTSEEATSSVYPRPYKETICRFQDIYFPIKSKQTNSSLSMQNILVKVTLGEGLDHWLGNRHLFLELLEQWSHNHGQPIAFEGKSTHVVNGSHGFESQ